MNWLSLFTLCLLAGSLAFGCLSAESPNEKERVVHAATAAQSGATPPCPSARRAWALDGQEWVEICYENEIPAQAQRWASDGRVVAAAGGTRCLAEPEKIDLWLLKGNRWEHYLPSGVSSNDLGSAGGAAIFDDHVFLFGGEPCDGANRALVMEFSLLGELISSTRVRFRRFWPLSFQVDDQLLQASSFSGSSNGGRVDIRDVPGTLLHGYNDCVVYASKDRALTPKRGKCKKSKYISPRGEPNTYAGVLTSTFDAVREEKIVLGDLEIQGPQEVLAKEEQLWSLKPMANAINEQGEIRSLTLPPVMGDGISLLWDPSNERVLLLDPGGSGSYFLEEDGTWTLLPHDPLPVKSQRNTD